MILQLFARSSLPIALAALSITLFYSQILTENIDLLKALFNFSATFIIYNFALYKKVFIQDPKAFLSSYFHRTLLFIAFLCLIIMALVIKYFGALDLINYTHLFFLSLFYDAFEGVRLRKLPYFKPFLISYIWMMSILGTYYYDNIIVPSPVFAIEFFLFIFSLCLMFDYRDRKLDEADGIKNIVNKLSLKQFKVLLLIFFILSSVFSLCYFCFSYFLVLNLIAHLALIYFLNDKREALYYLLGVDGLIILRGLLFFYST